MNYKNIVFAAAVGIALAGPVIPAAAEESQDDRFALFLEEKYKEVMEGDYMTLHYGLRDYEAHGIVKPELNIGTVSWEDYETDKADLEDILDELHAFDYNALNAEHQHDYKTYEFYLENMIALNGYPLFDFWFLPSTGLIDNLITNFTEFVFYEKEDFEDYLTVLSTVPEYMDGALDITEHQASEGYFMTDSALNETLEAINKFTAKTEDNQLIIIFNENVDAFEGLSEAEKEDYKARNREIVLNSYIPSYQDAATRLEALRGSRNGGDAVYDLPGGEEYYQALVRLKASRDATVDELLDICSEYLNNEIYNLIAVYNADSSVLVDIEDPKDVLSYLQSHLENYPEGPEVTFKVSYLDPSVANDSTVAYYMEPPVDDLKDNVVRINGSNISDTNDLYETMAHEGFPGHLYQITWYMDTKPSLLRTQLNNIGYTEGWAMYAESEAWQWSGLAEDSAQYLSLNTSLSYVMQAAVDLGINGKGWSVKEAGAYLEDLGFNSAVAEMLYPFVTDDPALLVPYGVGLAQFGNLRTKTENEQGDDFDVVEFHKILLTYGDRPFNLVEKDVEEYYAGGDTISATPAPAETEPEINVETTEQNTKKTGFPAGVVIGIGIAAGLAAAFIITRKKGSGSQI